MQLRAGLRAGATVLSTGLLRQGTLQRPGAPGWVLRGLTTTYIANIATKTSLQLLKGAHFYFLYNLNPSKYSMKLGLHKWLDFISSN